MERFKKSVWPLVIALAGLLFGGTSLLQLNTPVQQLGVTNLDSLHLSDNTGTATPVFMVNQDGTGVIMELRDASTPVAQWLDGGTFQVGAGGIVDLNGVADALVLDADADTSLSAPTDDQIDVEIGGADVVTLTATIVDIGGLQLDLDSDNDTSITASTNNQIDVEIGGTDEFIFTAGILDIGNGTLGRVDLDADNDTSVRSSADDQIDIEAGGTDVLTITTTYARFNSIFINLGEESAIAVTAGAIITPTGGYQPLTSAAEITASATTAIADGTLPGELLCLVNENASDVIHVPDAANTNLSGQADLGNDDVLCVLWDGADWLEFSQVDN